MLKKKLFEIKSMLYDIIIKLNERGIDLYNLEKKSEDLLESSEAFVVKTLPWYHRLRPPAWWFRSCNLTGCRACASHFCTLL